MSVSYVPAALRRLVITRAGNRCEYCLLHATDSFYGCEIDHAISEKHGGATDAANLAYSCYYCNRNKGSDIATLHPVTGGFVGFFHPRRDVWADHFAFSPIDNVTFVPLTDIGEATIRILGINDADRVWERLLLYKNGRYPR
jgi:hypothetical protein